MKKEIKVLLVEDDEDDFILTRELLKDVPSKQYLLRWAKTFEKGLSLMEKNVADIYLVDYRLGQHNGIELVKQARERGCQGPIIFLTGEADVDLDTTALHAGATDYLIKGQVTAQILEKSIRYGRERAKAEEERKKLIEAEKGIEIRDEFLNIASHELKTPLTSLQLQLQILEKKAAQKSEIDQEDIMTMLRTSQRQIKRLAQLINNLLDVSRISSQHLELETEIVELNEIVHDVLYRHDDAIKASGSEITILNGVKVKGHWDPFRLDQVITNLVSNAIKYGEGKPITIEIAKEKGLAVLVIADTGIGIDPKDKERIFDRFERTETAKNFGGLGLGLYIVKQIVEAHEGRIDVESQPHKGSTFTVKLPLNTAN